MKVKALCPECRNVMIHNDGKYSCHCGLSLSGTIFGVTIQDDDITSMSMSGYSREYTFTWSNGNKGKARLFYNKMNRGYGYKFSENNKYIPRKAVAT